MTSSSVWASTVASALRWEQAHASVSKAAADVPEALRGERPAGYPHSPWELLEHIRLTQRDLLEFCTNPEYQEPHWPDDYWPRSPKPPLASAWEACLSAIQRDADALADFAVEHADRLTERIPHGTGQTYLRTLLVALDHASYHAGQIVAVRRLLNAWR